jgi:hypothetical protein
MNCDKTKIFTLDEAIIGWVTPQGTFEDCLYGEHSEIAFDIVVSNLDWTEELRQLKKVHGGCYNARDFLLQEKNYILLNCPKCNGHDQYITYNSLKKHSHKQIQKLLTLFKDRPDVCQYILSEII